jgi:hypothetical protein
MKVELLRAIHWENQHRDAGEVIEVSDWDAHTLIAYGKARAFKQVEKPAENRSVGLTTSSIQKPAKRTYKKKA